MDNVRRRRVFDVMDLPHVARDDQNFVGLEFHERRRRNKPVHRHSPPVNLGENVVHLLNARNALKGDACIEQALKINFVSVFFKEENILPHDEAPDGVIHGRVIIVALIDGELQKMLWCGSDRRIIEADTAGSFHWHPPLRIKYDSFAERARGLGMG